MAAGDPYITRVELKDALGITSEDENDIIDRALLGASRAIEKRAGRAKNPGFWNTVTAVPRTIDVVGKIIPRGGLYPQLKVLLDDIADTAGFAVAGFTGARLLPSDAIFKGEAATAVSLPWGSTFGSSGTLTVTAIWGWPEVPDDIKFACQLQAQRYYKRRGSPDGVAGSAEWGLVTIPRLDPDVAAIISAGYPSPGIG